MKKVFLFAAGVFFILLGIIGWLLPVIPGWPFIFIGLSFIAPRFAEGLKRRVLRKFSGSNKVILKQWKKFGVQAGFTTRHFPLFLSKTDDLLIPANQSRFRQLLFEGKSAIACGRRSVCRFALLGQVHGSRVAALEDTSRFGAEGFYPISETDGAVTNIKGLVLLVMTADCLPIFFKAPGWVGLTHAGWRGTQERIARITYDLLKSKSGCLDSDVRVIFGPCIGFHHYEVGRELADILPKRSLCWRKGRLYFDLVGENRRQLFEGGAEARGLTVLDLCTVAQNRDFYSFRKEKQAAGRMVSFILQCE